MDHQCGAKARPALRPGRAPSRKTSCSSLEKAGAQASQANKLLSRGGETDLLLLPECINKAAPVAEQALSSHQERAPSGLGFPLYFPILSLSWFMAVPYLNLTEQLPAHILVLLAVYILSFLQWPGFLPNCLR